MYYFFTDETNKDISNDGQFFIFGGLIVPADKISFLHNEINRIRISNGYTKQDLLKFSPNSKPRQVSSELFKETKDSVLKLAHENGCLFIVYVIHHKIVKNELKNFSAVSHVIGRFNKFLEENKKEGLVFVDRMSDAKEQFSIMTDLFKNGLNLDGTQRREMKNILGYFVSSSESSNITAIVDIVLGGFRYCVNTSGVTNQNASKSIFKYIVEMMWGPKKGNKYLVLNMGLIFRPLTEKITVKKYKDEYDKLLKQLNELLN
jgi:hypothetical protein